MRECDIVGHLTLSSGELVIDLSAAGEVISLSLPSNFAFDLEPLAKNVEFHNSEIKVINQSLSDMGVALHIELAGRVVASMGRGSRAGLVSKALNLSPLRLHVIPLLAAFFAQKAGEISGR